MDSLIQHEGCSLMAGLSDVRERSPQGPAEGPASVLLVDDNPANLLVLKALLEDLPVTLVEAASGEEALAATHQREFAVILLDVRMPGISGFETARQIRAREGAGHTPIIFVTANDFDRSELEVGYALGAVDFLVKPLSAVVVTAKVAGFVDLYNQRRRTRHELEELRLLLESAEDYAIFMLDPHGHVASWNPGAERITRYRPDETIGEHFSRFYAPDAVERGWPAHELEVAEREGRFEDEGWRIRKDGTRFWANVVLTALRDRSGRLRGFSKITRDMTERKEAEENAQRLIVEATARRVAEEHARILQEQREQLHVTLASIGDAVISTDAAGQVRFLNPVAEQLLGWTSGAAANRPLQEVFQVIDEERGDPVDNLALRAISENRKVVPSSRTLLVSRTGDQIPIEESATPIRDGDGEVIGSVLIFRDIRERKRSEQHRNARLAVTQSLMHAASEEAGAHGVLQGVCEHLGWEIGLYWGVEPERGVIVCKASWCRDQTSLDEFLRDSLHRAFVKSEGLPGRVWETGKPAWVLSLTRDQDLARAAAAERAGLRSAFVCPVLVGDETRGALEFFTREVREPDLDLLEVMSTVAGSFGQFVERRRLEDSLRTSEARFRSLMEQAPFSIQVLSPDGRTLRVNRAWSELWGVEPSEISDYNLLEDPQLEAKGVLSPIKRAFAGEPTYIPAIQYGPNETLPDRTRHRETVRWVAAVAYPLKDENGIVREVVIVHEDITARRKAEVALGESEEKLRLMADTIPQLAWMAQPDGHIFWYNRQWYEYTGTTREEMEGWGWQKVHDPQVLPAVLERWQYSLETGEPFDMVFPLRGADGVLRPFLTRVNPLRDEHGRILYWFGTNTDIAELREAREALAASEERLRLALDAGRMGVWDWNIRTGELSWSESLEPLHGLAPGSFGGTFQDFQQLIHPDDLTTVNEAIRRAVDQNAGFDIEFRNVWPDGTVHWIAGKGKVFPGDDGLPARMIGIGMDVTKRKRQEQTARFLADASAALSVLVDFDSTLQKVASLAVPAFADWVAVDVGDGDGKLRRVAVAHVDPAKIQLAHEMHRRFPPDPRATRGTVNILRTGKPELVPQINDELLAQAVMHSEYRQLLLELGLKSFIGVPLRVRGRTLGVISFISAESGHLYDVQDLAVAEDLANRTAIAIENSQLYRELRDADRRKDEFLATLAHELRNPLAPIRNGLQILQLAGNDPAAAAEARSMMERQLGQMVRLVDDLLDVSRITRNKLELRKQEVELSAVIHSAVETSRPLMEQSRHSFSLILPEQPIYLNADPVRLAQVFSNLLNNSAKYTDPQGSISLRAELEDGQVAVRVRDNGLGIPAEALNNIFEMFSQVDRHWDRSQGGLGIGLTLVRRLVEMHGGTVEAWSEGMGKGSEFVVRLPVRRQPESFPQLPQKPGDTKSSRLKILVVDDNHDAAASLGMVLSLMGHDIHSAEDGLAAVEAADQFRPDLILLDIGLPKIDGYEACRQIRQRAWSQSTTIVALTGWGQEEDRRRSQEAGFDRHLVKPVDMDELLRLLDEAQNKVYSLPER